MPGRKFSSNSYRYGFNGMESDFEVFNSGSSSYTAEFWQYDSRLGRRWNLDPVDQISISNYATFANNPILLSDPNGDTPGEGDPKKAKSVPECQGDGCKTVRGPISADGNNGGYDVNIPAGATTVNQKQSFSIAGKPDNVIDVTTGFGYYEGDEFKYYGWSSEMNGFYNYKTNEVYGGDGVATAEGYINSQMGTQLGSPYHPGYSTGAKIGGTQNVVNTVAVVANVAQLGYMGVRWGVGKYVTSRLTRHLAYSMENYTLTARQNFAISLSPGSANRYIGTQIDALFKVRVQGDMWLKPMLKVTPAFRFGPDAYNKTFNLWWDVTTPNQWNLHVDKYEFGFGKGTPLFWR